ncbi:MAG: prepilin peptidase [Candidatus Shapirobacteria bacterium]|jgi:prepilin signal peptidase PulO-like enzyme (type II secretory pathway)
MNLFLEIMVFVLGLCIGSFINMAVYRTAKKYKILKSKDLKIKNKNRSYCDFCGRQLNWFDNIPVLSWLFYRGKSRCCGKRLPLLYPVVEIITGLLFLLNYELSITNYELLIINFLIFGLLIFEAAFDFQYMTLPDATAYALIILAAIRWILIGMPVSYLVYAVISALFIFILHKIKIKDQEAMGDGDIFLAGFMGLFLGFPNIIVAFYVAFIVGAIVGVILIKLKKVGRLSPIPFGPFLILGTIIAYYWGEKIIQIITNY